MKRTAVPLLACLLLAACGGGGSQEAACEFGYWDGQIGTCLPEGWHALERGELDDRGVPAEVVTAFQSDTPVSGQFATVTVTREVLTTPLSSTEYSEASVQSVQGLPGYDEVDQKDIEIDGEEVSLHVFTAQPRDDQPESRFYQVSAVSGTTGYTFTAATPVSVGSDLEEQILLILRSATFTKPEGE
jgi:hypothetical protein